ncbi:hypothetical protein AVO45_09085 [Ruegeria marisrubri]|uniref:Glycosyltransferase subfamily 4-like N-terminal domain-containing protein n=1 Tax=Ruegeria marisrubri TaxID=1685379 RepID=A0A0X3TQS6_9RHOB|nr:glycosyltransferase [Ruegeria marisrubri]KUJ78102.1 hypothetical protein AVO45_09085 [Ruegeria marisrubri]
MRKTKILALTKSTGGIAFYNKLLLSSLNREQFESHTICLSEGSQSYAEGLRSLGLGAEEFPMDRYRISPVGDLRVLRHVLKVARSRNIDILVCHGSKAGFLGRVAGRILKIPAINRQASMPFLKRVQGRKAPIYWALEAGAGFFGGTTVAITDHARRESLKKRVVSANAIHVIRTGVDTDRFRPLGLRETVAAELGLDPARPIVGWLGRLEPQKAPLDYVEALREVAPGHPDVQFVIAGEGNLRKEVEHEVRKDGQLENVLLLPWQKDPARALQAMDIFAMSSHWEGLPLTLLEAMASGCAPVSTTVDGCVEAIESGVSGLLVPPGDPSAMAKALDELLSFPDRRRSMAIAARQRVLDLFDRRRMIREWEEFLLQQVESSRPDGPEKGGLEPPQQPTTPEASAPQAPMRICMVISSYHPVVGGAEKQVAQIARIMTDMGHSVRVITRRYPGLAPFETIDGVDVQRVGGGGPKTVAALRFVLGATRAIRSFAPDVIHCHSAFSPTLAGLLGGVFPDRPVLVKPMCGGELTSVLSKTGGHLRGAAMKRKVSRFVAVSSEIEQELLQFGFPASRILRIPNGVDTDRFRPCREPLEKSKLRESLGLPDGILVLFAGRLARQKRLPLLLEAWPEVRSRCPDVTLLIAGANRKTSSGFSAAIGDAEDVPAHLLEQDGVLFLGHVDDMPSCLRACDIFVLPSAREGLSNVLLEACASGLIVVASQVGGTEDVIENGRNGVMFAPDSLDELSAALVQLTADIERHRGLGASARETISRRFDVRKTAERLLMTYATLCSSGEHPPEAGIPRASDPNRS